MKVVCSVFDTKAKLWSTPFFSHSNVTAIRDFAAAAKSGGGIAQFPADYELWSLGKWDEETGNFHLEQSAYLARGNDFTQEV